MAKVLQSLLPQTETLYHFLKRKLTTLGSQGKSTLHHLRKNTNVIFLNLMDQTLVAEIANVQNFQEKSVGFQCRMSMEELLHFAISILLHKKQNNVLSAGYQICQPNGKLRVASAYGLECFFPHNYVDQLKSIHWKTLHEKIGDDIMIALLLNCSIFVVLPNKCYMQIVGIPLVQEYYASQAFKNQKESGNKPQKRKKDELFSTRKKKKSSHPTIIPRHKMLYSNQPSRLQFEKNHILHQLTFNKNISNRNARLLISEVFLFNNQNSLRRLPRRLISALPHFLLLLKRYQSINLKRIFKTITFCNKTNNSHNHEKQDWESHKYLSETNYWHLKDFHVKEEGYHSQEIEEEYSGQEEVDYEECHDKEWHDTECHDTEWHNKECHDTEWHDTLSCHDKASCCHDKASCHDKAPCHKDDFGFFKAKNKKHSNCNPFCRATPMKKVFEFVRIVMGRLVPVELWGSNHNRSVFLKGIHKFLSCGKLDKVSIEQMMQSMKLSHVKWLQHPSHSKMHHSPPSDMEKKVELFEQWMTWVYIHLVIPLIRSQYYVTESESKGNQLIYFSHACWYKIRQKKIKELIPSFYQQHSSKDVDQQGGYSTIRLLPKASGTRIIANLSSKQSGGGSLLSKSVNGQLQNVFQVLKHEMQSHPEMKGSSVHGMDEIYQRLFHFVKIWKSNEVSPCKKLYFVSMDIQHCFDTINHEKLKTIVDEIFSVSEYLIQKHWILSSPKTNVFDGVLLKKVFRVSSPGDLEKFEKLARKFAHSAPSQSVFVDGVGGNYQNRQNLRFLLLQHIFRNIVKIGSQYYAQKKGIPQGSVVSTLLCNSYYGSIEKSHIFPLLDAAEKKSCSSRNKECSTLLRLTDDFLYITTSLPAAREFASQLHQGLPEFGLITNPMKTKVNFDIEVKHGNKGTTLKLPRFDQVNGHGRLEWCGFLIDPATCEVRGNYTRYQDLPVRYTINIDNTHHAGKVFKKKMKQYIRPKCHILLIDPTINSIPVIHENIYELFMVSALKFHTHVSFLAPASRKNVCFFVNVVLDVIHYCYQLLRARGRHRFFLSKSTIFWLGLKAYHNVLARKGILYETILQQLRDHLKIKNT